MEANQLTSSHQTSIFQSLLHKIQMELTEHCNLEDNYYSLSQYHNSDRGYKSESMNWVWQDECSETEREEQMKDLILFEQIHELQKIQSSRINQQNKIAQYFKNHKLSYHQKKDRDQDSLQRTLRNNLNLSPRKKKIIDKQKNKQSKLKCF